MLVQAALSLALLGFGPRVDNPYFPLRPGTTLRYRGVEEGRRSLDVVTVTRRAADRAVRLVPSARDARVDAARAGRRRPQALRARGRAGGRAQRQGAGRAAGARVRDLRSSARCASCSWRTTSSSPGR